MLYLISDNPEYLYSAKGIAQFALPERAACHCLFSTFTWARVSQELCFNTVKNQLGGLAMSKKSDCTAMVTCKAKEASDGVR
jgi:hypothetical protein